MWVGVVGTQKNQANIRKRLQVVGKGTASFGKRHNKTHTLCRRCGKRTFHLQKSTCAACGYPSKHMRQCKTPLSNFSIRFNHIPHTYLLLRTACRYAVTGPVVQDHVITVCIPTVYSNGGACEYGLGVRKMKVWDEGWSILSDDFLPPCLNFFYV